MYGTDFGVDPTTTSAASLTPSDLHPSFYEYVSAQGAQAIQDSPVSSGYRMWELSRAEGPRMSARDANALAAESGLSIDFGDGDLPKGAVDIMIDRAFRRRRREETISAYNPNMALQLGTTFVASLADPVNVGLAFIPFVGEARYAAMLKSATTVGQRVGVRAGVGAIEGLGGAALAEPLLAGARIHEGSDYGLAESVRNLAFGAGFGSGLHVASGAVRDVLKKRATPASGHLEPVASPVDTVDRAPLEVKEAALRAAISDLMHDRPVAASEVIDVLLRDNPSVAEAIHNAGTLRRGGPDLADVEGRVKFWEGRLTGADQGPQTLRAWIAEHGGVRDTTGEVRAAVDMSYPAVGTQPELPRELFIQQKGVKATKRGLELDAMVAQANADGFKVTREDIVAALHDPKAAERVRAGQEKAAAAHAEERTHDAMAAKEAGVNPRAKPNTKARAIAAWEQKILAAEKARIASAASALVAREADYRAELAAKAEPPKPVVVAKGEAVAAPAPAEVAPAPKAEPVSTEKPAKTQIADRAREYAPAEFAERDQLRTQQTTYRRWLAELGDLRGQELAAEIEALQAKPVSPKNRKSREAKLQAMREKLHLERSTDTADMAKVRGELQKADYRLRELAPTITKAMRKAGKDVASDLQSAIAKAADRPPETTAAKPGAEPTAATSEAAPAAPMMRERADTPEAPREALNTAELDALTKQYEQVRTFAETKLAEYAAHLEPEAMQGIRDIVSRLRAEHADFETLATKAAECLLAP